MYKLLEISVRYCQNKWCKNLQAKKWAGEKEMLKDEKELNLEGIK